MSSNVSAILARPGRPARLLLPAWIAAGVVLVVATALGASAPPAELRGILPRLAIGIALLLGAVRPWSYCRAWGRSLVALALWTPWMAVHVATVGADDGAGTMAHAAWTVATWVALGGAVIVSTVARRRLRPAPVTRRVVPRAA